MADDGKANADGMSGWGDRVLYEGLLNKIHRHNEELNRLGAELSHGKVKITEPRKTISVLSGKVDDLYSRAKEFEDKYDESKSLANLHKITFDVSKKMILEELTE